MTRHKIPFEQVNIYDFEKYLMARANQETEDAAEETGVSSELAKKAWIV